MAENNIFNNFNKFNNFNNFNFPGAFQGRN